MLRNKWEANGKRGPLGRLQRHEYALDSQKIGGSQSGVWTQVPVNAHSVSVELVEVGIMIIILKKPKRGDLGWFVSMLFSRL